MMAPDFWIYQQLVLQAFEVRIRHTQLFPIGTESRQLNKFSCHSEVSFGSL